MAEFAFYWLGVMVWVGGFFLYLYSSRIKALPKIARIASALCLIGFIGTATPQLMNYQHTPFEWPDSIDLQHWSGVHIHSLTRAGWIVGFALLVASWLRLVNSTIGWTGFTIAMAAVAASWTERKEVQGTIAMSAIILLLMLLLSTGMAKKGSSRPGDYEAELIRLCHGDKAVAMRLIEGERKRKPSFSRQGAAAAAVTRLRHDRNPNKPL